ncbi:hypothetical protein [Kordiimonas sp. SCSIO 12610]|uniref:hypothetical protein n=1 Tax=Kordiimonas sp. SCSIO 12610 TaxID=2829597 RepID=UPI002108F4DF|nr:hypothetical protein [Kordiimonas sp. SCSIO 12610]UTW55813.1 hypothetical protein KFF44_02670 [Kordiimonas sp. SCSIO 12610]
MTQLPEHETLSALDALKAEYPWPDVEGVTPWDYTLGGGGRELVDALINQHKPKVFLEIGCFLCSSSKRWLEQKEDMTVIGVDPWDDALIEQCNRYVGRPKLTREYPDIEVQKKFARDVKEQSPFRTALANVRSYRDRFIPVRGTSPDMLYKIHASGVTPDIVYIDADKKIEDLEVAHSLWPNALITGDDWHWSRTKGYPMRQVVYAFAEKYGFEVEASWATWILKR